MIDNLEKELKQTKPFSSAVERGRGVPVEGPDPDAV
jgi:hypothetical protein